MKGGGTQSGDGHLLSRVCSRAVCTVRHMLLYTASMPDTAVGVALPHSTREPHGDGDGDERKQMNRIHRPFLLQPLLLLAPSSRIHYRCYHCSLIVLG